MRAAGSHPASLVVAQQGHLGGKREKKALGHLLQTRVETEPDGAFGWQAFKTDRPKILQVSSTLQDAPWTCVRPPDSEEPRSFLATGWK